MIDLDTLAESLSKRGHRVSLMVILHENGRSHYMASSCKPGKADEAAIGYGGSPMAAFESLALDTMKGKTDALDSALGRLVSAFSERSDAV